MAALFHFRGVTEEDEAFRYRLFTETAGAEFMAIVGDQRLLQMQYRGREMSYASQFPGAKEWLICLSDGKPVGRVLLDLQPGVMRLVDIGLLEVYRGQGIGKTIVQNLQQQCQDRRSELVLQVAQTSHAKNLYWQMGFTEAGHDAVYAQMKWQPMQTVAR
ncbi:MAG: GNAT family N-acetyltransferase [Silvibacterium sp.]